MDEFCEVRSSTVNKYSTQTSSFDVVFWTDTVRRPKRLIDEPAFLPDVETGFTSRSSYCRRAEGPRPDGPLLTSDDAGVFLTLDFICRTLKP
jgi:hypothetical protein